MGFTVDMGLILNYSLSSAAFSGSFCFNFFFCTFLFQRFFWDLIRWLRWDIIKWCFLLYLDFGLIFVSRKWWFWFIFCNWCGLICLWLIFCNWCGLICLWFICCSWFICFLWNKCCWTWGIFCIFRGFSVFRGFICGGGLVNRHEFSRFSCYFCSCIFCIIRIFISYCCFWLNIFFGVCWWRFVRLIRHVLLY